MTEDEQVQPISENELDTVPWHDHDGVNSPKITAGGNSVTADHVGATTAYDDTGETTIYSLNVPGMKENDLAIIRMATVAGAATTDVRYYLAGTVIRAVASAAANVQFWEIRIANKNSLSAQYVDNLVFNDTPAAVNINQSSKSINLSQQWVFSITMKRTVGIGSLNGTVYYCNVEILKG